MRVWLAPNTGYGLALLQCVLCQVALCADLPTVAVLDLRVAEGLPASAGRDLADVIRSEIVKTGKFRLLNRENMQQILDEQDFSQSERCDDTSCLVKVGKMLAVQRMVGGNVSKLGRTYKLYLSFTNVSTGKVENSLTERCRGEIDGLLDVAEVATWKLLGLEPLESPEERAARLARFRVKLTAAQTAYVAERHADALQALEEAAREKPSDPDVAGLRIKVQAAQRQELEAQLASLLEDARSAVTRNDWAAAGKAVATVLTVRPNDAGALRLRERAAALRQRQAMRNESMSRDQERSRALQDRAVWRLERTASRKEWTELPSALNVAEGADTPIPTLYSFMRKAGVPVTVVRAYSQDKGFVVRFTSAPGFAEVFVDGDEERVGYTPCEWIWDGRPRVTYRVCRSLHQDYQGTLRLDPDDRQAWKVSASLHRLEVLFRSIPSGASVFINGLSRAVGQTPCEWSWDGRADLTYRLTLPKHFDSEGKLRLDPERSTLWRVEAQLEEWRKTVMLPRRVPLELVWIPPGEFLMGSPANENGRDTDEGPQRRMRITQGFWMGKYEVTQEQWEAVMANNPSRFGGDKRRPVESVSWSDCQDFLKKLNSQLRVPNSEFRLPREAEWEHAYRAGTTTRFYWGDDPNYTQIGDYAWYGSNSLGKTHPVGQKRPNAWNLHDIGGNVREWCEDVYHGKHSEGRAPRPDARGASSESCRVLRGGSWLYVPRLCRAATRDGPDPSFRWNTVGFRVVCPRRQQ